MKTSGGCPATALPGTARIAGVKMAWATSRSYLKKIKQFFEAADVPIRFEVAIVEGHELCPGCPGGLLVQYGIADVHHL